MQYSLNLLKKYININDDIQNISNNLTLKTCEIEEIKTRNIPSDVVIGRVIKTEKHPDADKLNVTQVDCGPKGIYQIVTGAENIRADIFAPVSLPGCFLPAINLKIEPRKMRGLDSNGMICAKEELGINEDHDIHGIWILEEDFEDISMEDLGKPLAEKYPWLENHILDVDNKTLTHRPDLTGHFGLAVDLNGIYCHTPESIKFTKISEYLQTFSDTNIFELLSSSTKGTMEIDVQTKDLFSYIALEINNIEVKRSDFFTRLSMIDLASNPRNNWVDFSNIFMLASSHPVHFFDKSKIDGKIIVRNAKDGEQFTDLFDKTHTLISSDIVIADNSKILALGGIVGGKESGVSETTKDIIVEIGNFDSVQVRKTGTRLGLRTDAELRYEKHINPLFSLYTLILFLDEIKLFEKTLGNYKISGLNYFINENINSYSKAISFDFGHMEHFIFGETISGFQNTASNILNSIGYQFVNNSTLSGHVEMKVPVWRSPDDMNIKEDIYEEVARIYGYDNIGYKTMNWKVENIPYSIDVQTIRKTEVALVDKLGFDQVETYPFVEESLLDLFTVDKNNLFSLQNPIAPELSYMRDNMIYNLLGYIEKNFRFYDTINIFDIGKVWNKKQGEATSMSTGGQTGESTRLGIISYQKVIKNWKEDNMLYMKGVVSELLGEYGLIGDIDYMPTADDRFHPKKQGEILIDGKSVGTLQILHPVYFERFDLPEKCQVTYVEINLDTVKKMISDKKVSMGIAEYETLQDQIVYRDLNFVLDKTDNFGKVSDAVRKVEGVKDLTVFDIYSGENLPEDKKSIAVKMKIVGDGKMTTEAINTIMNNAIASAERVGAKLRG